MSPVTKYVNILDKRNIGNTWFGRTSQHFNAKLKWRSEKAHFDRPRVGKQPSNHVF